MIIITPMKMRRPGQIALNHSRTYKELAEKATTGGAQPRDKIEGRWSGKLLLKPSRPPKPSASPRRLNPCRTCNTPPKATWPQMCRPNDAAQPPTVISTRIAE